MKTTIKLINRQTSLQAITLVLIANLILALIYYKTLFVWQSSINMAQLDGLSLDDGTRVCQNSALGAYLERNPYPECANWLENRTLRLQFQYDKEQKR